MAESPARAMIPSSSSSLCPGCGKAVDALRAGHVAIYDGHFLYYCDARCKAAHLLLVAQHVGDDVATLDPPAVMERMATMPASGEVLRTPYAPPVSATASGEDDAIAPRSVREASEAEAATTTSRPPSVAPRTLPSPPLEPASQASRESREPIASGAQSTERATKSAAFPAPASRPGPRVGSNASIVAAPVSASIAAPVSVASLETDAHPKTLRSPAVPSDGARSPESTPSRDRAARAITMIGLASGLLVPVLSLAGETAAATARLPLVVIAALALVMRLAMRPRDPADASPFIVAVPVLCAAAAAVCAAIFGAPHAVAIACFAAIAAAGTLFVELALARARREVDAIRDAIARTFDANVRVVRGEDTALVSPDMVKPGEQVVVAEGEMVGIDGIVAAGDAVVIPWHKSTIEMKKTEGDPVAAGARVVSGRLRLRTTWAAQDRAWTKLSLSRTSRVDVASPIVRTARALVERGTPIAALLVAAAAFANATGVTGTNSAASDTVWIDVLAAACAAALAMGGRGVVGAVALVKARGQLFALEHGVVYKDAAAFDDAARTDVAVVCSRGTVLMGEPEIVALEPLGPDNARLDVERLITLAAGAETASTHPFAAAILRAARARGQRPDNVRSATVHAGLGVTALASNGEHLVVGSRALLLQEKVSVALADARISELEAQGRSVLLVALGGKLVGLFALQDGLRSGARAAVQRLLDARIEPVLLSGEARETCETLGRALDIEHIRPEVLPVDRGAEVRALGEGGHVIAVIGHPSTDDGALGAADVSIAMCSAGATPGEWAVALASDDVRDAALALGVAHATRDRARIALAIGLVPGVITLLTLAFGIAGLLVAPLAVTLGTIAALLHARR